MIMTTLALVAFVLLLAQLAVRSIHELRIDLGDNANEVLTSLNLNTTPFRTATHTLQQQHPYLALLGIVALVRGATWLLAWLLYMVKENRYVGFVDSFQTIWLRWDAQHYLDIAEHGYLNVATDERFNLVFYPLYPALIAALRFIGIPTFAAGVLLSLSAFAAATVLLYRLVERETGNQPLAWDSAKILCLFPFSFYFAMPYTESVFLLLTIAAFWFLRDGRWLAAGAVAALAGLTRNQGILLGLPFVIEIALRWRNGQLNQPRRALLGLMLVPLGFIAYLALNRYVAGDWFRFVQYQQQNWTQTFGFMPANVAGAFERVFSGEILIGLGTWLPTVICYFAAIALLASSGRAIPLPYLAYSAVFLLVSYSPSWLLSGPRYLMSLFPLAIATSMLMQRHRFWQQSIELLMLIGLGFFLLMYLNYQVY